MAHVLPDLLERLEHEEGLWRSSEPGNVEKSEESAVDAAVRAFGPYDLPRMFELLDHDEFNLSYAAAGAFREAGLDAIAYFEGAWASASPTRRQKMLGVLRDLLRRKDAAAVLPAVRQLAARGLDDPNPRVRLQATKTLQGDSLHRDLCLDVLAALLEAPDIHTVRSAAYRISALEPPAARVEAVLRTHAEHPDAETRGYVRTALERIEDAR